MEQLQQVLKNGFSFDSKGNVETDLALISLKIALKAYFSTYQTFKGRLHLFLENSNADQADIDFNHSNAYCEACAETIVHFQHFAELVCKTLLRDDHPLLATVASTKAEVQHKLLHGIDLSIEEQNTLRSIEFSEALDRLLTLVKKQSLKNHSSLSFMKNHKATLAQLNTLRNRIWHRGLYILRYQALDSFVVSFVLPFVADVLKMPSFKHHAKMWKYNTLHSQIDPVDEILKEASNNKLDIGKLAMLKEMGRAAYESPLAQGRHVDEKLKKILSSLDKKEKLRAERIANLEASQEYSDVKVCPVCGANSLIVYDETEFEHGEDMDDIISAWRYTYMIKCECCTFNLDRDVKNASDYGLSGVDDYWKAEDLT